MSDTISVFPCPDCGLWMSRMERVDIGDGWTGTRCWDCGYQFGVWGDKGTLDLGIVREDPPSEAGTAVAAERLGVNKPEFFYEEFTGVLGAKEPSS